jgi:glutaredoxin
MLTVYSKQNCSFCDQAKRLLTQWQVPFREIDIETDDAAREFLQQEQHRTVPQIYMDGKLFVAGGWQGLSKMTLSEIREEIELRDSLANGTL